MERLGKQGGFLLSTYHAELAKAEKRAVNPFQEVIEVFSSFSGD